MNKLKVSPRQKNLFVVVLISLASAYSFLVAWNEISLPDEISVIPYRVVQKAEAATEENEKLRLFDSLKTVINSYLAKKPGNTYLNYYLAYAYARLNDYQKSMAIHRKNLSKLDSVKDKEIYTNSKMELARCHYMIGVKLVEQGDSARGMNYIFQSFTYVPYYSSAVETIALWDIRNNRVDSAKKILGESLRVDPQNVGLLNMSGYVYYLEKDSKQAESFLMQAYKLDPGNVDTNKFLKLIRDQSAK